MVSTVTAMGQLGGLLGQRSALGVRIHQNRWPIMTFLRLFGSCYPRGHPPRISGVEPTETTAQPLVVVPGTHIMAKKSQGKRSDHCRFTSLLSERLAHKACLTGGPESPDSLRRRLDPWGDDRSKLASGSQLFNGALQHKYIRLKLGLSLR